MAQSIAKNALFNLLYKGLSILFPLITVTYASRVLLANGMGLISFAQSIVAYFAIFASLGIPNYGIREIARQSNQENENRTFTSILLLNTIFTFVCCVIYYTSICLSPYFLNERALFLVVGLSIILNFFNVDWYYQGKEEYVYIAIRSFIVKILFVILLFLFIKSPQDYVKYAFLYYLAVAGNNLFNFFHLRKFVRLDFKEIHLRHHIKPILVFFSATVVVEIYLHLDVTMLGILSEKANVGYYDNCVKIVKVIANSLMAIGAVLLPRISKYFKEGKKEDIQILISKLIHLMIFLSFPIAISIVYLAKFIIIILFGYNFLPAITTLQIMSALVVIFSMVGGVTTPILLSTNHEKQYFYTSVFATLINFGANLILIPVFQQNGSAIASILTQSFLMISQLYLIRGLFPMRELKGLLKTKLVYISIMIICYYFLDILIPDTMNLFVHMMLLAIIGNASYIIISYLFKDESLLFLLSKVRINI